MYYIKIGTEGLENGRQKDFFRGAIVDFNRGWPKGFF